MPITLWLTGYSGSGKTTLAFALEAELLKLRFTSFALDGDNLRHGLCGDLSFSRSDRAENIRRVAEVAKIMNDAGLIVITSFISPYLADRELAKQIIGPSRFYEIHLDTPLDVCEQRDPKGLYKLARSGIIKDFTGIDAPYEIPPAPSLRIDTTRVSVNECVSSIYHHVISRLRDEHATL